MESFADKNECLNVADNKCMAQTTECVNTIGSFECKCRAGFERIDNPYECVGE